MNNKSLITISILILVLSGFYYLITDGTLLLNQDGDVAEESNLSADIKSQTEQLSIQGESDSLTEIENDVENTDLDDLERELLDIEEELDQL